MAPGRDPDDGRWFNYSAPRLQLYAYSAFYDDRPSLAPGRPLIRIIAITKNLSEWMNKLGLPNQVLRCRLRYADGRVEFGGLDAKQSKPVGHGWPMNGDFLLQYILACPLPASKDDEIPTALSFFVHPANNISAAFIPIERPDKPDKALDFAVCVPVAFNHLDRYRLIEWLEMQRLLGVSQIGVYDFNLDKTSLDLLRHYVADGLVELRKSNHISDGKKPVCIIYNVSHPEMFGANLTILCLCGLDLFCLLNNYFPASCCQVAKDLKKYLYGFCHFLSNGPNHVLPLFDLDFHFQVQHFGSFLIL